MPRGVRINPSFNRKIRAAQQRAADQILKDAARVGKQELRRVLPRDTGALQDSVVAKRTGRFRVTIRPSGIPRRYARHLRGIRRRVGIAIKRTRQRLRAILPRNVRLAVRRGSRL